VIGYWLSSEEHAPGALVGHARAAEDAGYRTAMISDHAAPWVPAQGESPFVWSVLGAIAATTHELCVGTGVSTALHRLHPVSVAQAAATVAGLMPGRFFLGLGAGERLNEHMTGRRWPAAKERRAALRDAVRAIRDLLDGKTVTRESAHFRLEQATIHSRPDTPPPIAVAASGKRTARLAGEDADAMIGVAPASELVDAFEHAGGADRPRLGQVHVCWAPTPDAARATAAHWWPHAAVPGRLLSELALPSDIAAVARLCDADAVTREVVCGPDPEPIVATIRRFVAAGYTAVYLHQVGPDQDGFLEFSTKELLPRFEMP
jgi:G6PDH family F420-dependent oxidoreductase